MQSIRLRSTPHLDTCLPLAMLLRAPFGMRVARPVKRLIQVMDLPKSWAG